MERCPSGSAAFYRRGRALQGVSAALPPIDLNTIPTKRNGIMLPDATDQGRPPRLRGCRPNTRNKVAARAGIEPATKRLTAACSTTELPGKKKSAKETSPPAVNRRDALPVRSMVGFHPMPSSREWCYAPLVRNDVFEHELRLSPPMQIRGSDAVQTDDSRSDAPRRPLHRPPPLPALFSRLRPFRAASNGFRSTGSGN